MSANHGKLFSTEKLLLVKKEVSHALVSKENCFDLKSGAKSLERLYDKYRKTFDALAK